MPELPEVETVVRGLREPLSGRMLGRVWVGWLRTITPLSAEMFQERVMGQTIHKLSRRAKYIILHLDHDELLIHLKMTGRLYVVPQDQPMTDDPWVRVRFDLDNGHSLCFSDARKFGRIQLATGSQELLSHLGPEPLEESFSATNFYERLKGRAKSIKALLLDQTFIAGVGNIYADEALFRAQIHPQTRSDGLSETQAQHLYEAVRAALSDGIAHEGASINWYRKADGGKGSSQQHFYVYGRDGQLCLKCGYTIEKIRVAQRGTHFCPHCQVRDD